MGSDQIVETELKPRIFISYSRKDKSFVDWLVGRLETEWRLEVFLDKNERRDTPVQIAKGIGPAEDWWDRLQEMIRHIDIFVFVISPASVASTIANQEVDYAVSLNKRLVPVLYKEPGAPLPAALAKLDYLFLDQPERLDDGVIKLCFVLENDIAIIREHTRLVEAAERWRTRNSDSSLLLRGDALMEGEYWLRKRRQNDPEPTPLLVRFLTESRTHEEIDRRERMAQIDRALTNESRYLARLARQSMVGGDYAEALNIALEALPDVAAGRVRPHVAEAERALDQAVRLCRERLVFPGRRRPDDWIFFKFEPWAPITAAGINADGTVVFLAVETMLRVFAASTGVLLNELDCGQLIHSARIVGDQTRIVAMTGGGLVCWDYGANREISRVPLQAATLKVHSFNASGSHCAVWTGGHVISIFETIGGALASETAFEADFFRSVSLDGTAETLCVWVGRRNIVRKAGAQRNLLEFDQVFDPGFATVFSASGKLLMSEDRNWVHIRTTAPAKKKLWSRALTDPVRLIGHEARIHAAAFSHDETRIATASEDGNAVVWHADDGRIVSEFRGHRGEVRDVIFCGDTGLVASSGQDGTTRIWHAESGKQVFVLGGHRGRAIRTAYSPRTQTMASWSDDGTARLWDANAEHNRRLIARLDDTIWSVTFDRSGERLAVTSQDGTARIWRVVDGAEQACLRVSEQAVYDASFSSDGRLLVTASLDTAARVWDLGSPGQCIATLPHRSKVSAASYSPNGTFILTACTDGSAQVWGAQDFRLVRSLADHPSGVEQAIFSPDEKYVLTIASSGAAYLWDLQYGLRTELFDMGSLVSAAVFAPGGGRICLATLDRRLRLYDIAGASYDDTLPTDEASEAVADRLCYSADGMQLLSTDRGGKVRVRSATDGLAVAILPAEGGGLTCACFGPNGESIAGVLNEQWLYLWSNFKTTQLLVDDAKRLTPRGLNREDRRRLHLSPEPPQWYSELGKWAFEPVPRR